ncbi:BlaI/MecI/CopY family transcriptional regulator [Stieleria varia]|uniref:Penicillinase repressor n=1 Tax=Stieleria varia TaxID=2528005 RepID=A0A5C6ANA4_9BACT|nr:BlaI/MecI/CopY family transcriptional regulator [Stieleria varia]TWU00978.1 Penicillinase repressor [Stieleria varia]
MSMDADPTEREMEILKVLWEIQEGSVREVHERLTPESGLHFNTIQTQLRIMDDKGLVKHRREGRVFLYRPQCTREDVSSRFVKKVYDGAVNELMLNMLRSEKLSDKELQELEAMIAEARSKKSQKRKKRS